MHCIERNAVRMMHDDEDDGHSIPPASCLMACVQALLNACASAAHAGLTCLSVPSWSGLINIAQQVRRANAVKHLAAACTCRSHGGFQ